MLNRIVGSVVSRLPATSPSKRNLVTTALWHLQDVAYTRLRDRGFTPGGIIDIGACSGEWSRSTRKIFPQTPILMIEARSEEEQRLKVAAKDIGRASYAICLMGADKAASVPFVVSDTGSSVFAERSNAPRTLTSLPMTTLDAVVTPHVELAAPLFVKLDVQGAELEIIKGGTRTLAMAEIVQLETALLNYNDGAPTAAETIAFMDSQGFAVFDIAGFIRPNGVDLIQVDIIFARKGSKLRPDKFVY
jgi:FkbM family methyltransferase